MKKVNCLMLIVLLLSAGLLAACGPKASAVEKVPPSKTEPIDGSDFQRLTLTEKAAERLAIQTSAVQTSEMDGSEYKVIPYAAVLYGLDGETWAYTNPEPLVYVRENIVIDHIDGDMAVLSEGPEADVAVVTVGVSLLYGAETGVSK